MVSYSALLSEHYVVMLPRASDLKTGS